MQFCVIGHAAQGGADVMPSAACDARLGLSVGTLEAKTGVRARRVLGVGQTARSLAGEVASLALARAGLAASDLGAVVGACAVPFRPIPSSAALLAYDLGVTSGVDAFDVNATCLSFLYAFRPALERAVRTGRPVLVFSSDAPSRAVPWATDPETAALFGDGAAAVVVVAKPNDSGAPCWRLVGDRFEAFPEHAEVCTLPAGGSDVAFHGAQEAFADQAWFAMNGPRLFRATHRSFPGFVERLEADTVARSRWTAVAAHQASPFALGRIRAMLGLDDDRMPCFAADEGNQVSASLPSALCRILDGPAFAPGDTLAFLGTGAGLVFGGMVWERL